MLRDIGMVVVLATATAFAAWNTACCAGMCWERMQKAAGHFVVGGPPDSGERKQG
jgi:hypothetical protein